MKTPVICLAALLAAGYATSCAKNIDTTDAVKQGVIKDIGKKVDVQNMDVNVDSVSFRGKEADAKVSFSPKGGGASQSIVMNYSLERVGDEWHIKSREMQTGHTPATQGTTEGATPGAGALPPGHPTTPGGAGGQLPAGHPSVDTAPKQ